MFLLRAVFRTHGYLNKPFTAVCDRLQLPYRVTPRGMWRTFQYLTRDVGVKQIVQQELCDHTTRPLLHRESG